MKGLKVTVSDFTVADTLSKMVSQIEKEGWLIFTLVDHAQEALKKGLKLHRTELILFGKDLLPPPEADTNKDGVIDLMETHACSVLTMVPFHGAHQKISEF